MNSNIDSLPTLSHLPHLHMILAEEVIVVSYCTATPVCADHPKYFHVSIQPVSLP